MSVRKTESRIPDGFTSDDLGEKAVSGTNAKVILVSYLSSPLAARRIQNYVVFVTDNSIAPNVMSYEWTFANGSSVTQTTSIGIAEFTPQNVGTLTVTVRLKNGANATLETVILTQQVTTLNEALELKIEQEENNFPGAGNPETSRELVNDIRPYVNAVLPISTDEIYNKAISSIAYACVLKTTQIRRNLLNEDLVEILENKPADFYAQSKGGIGICKTRPQLLAMFVDDPANTGKMYLDANLLELKADAKQTDRKTNATAIETAFNALSTSVHIDIFNLLRFPKSHVAMAKKIMDGIHARYYDPTTTSIGATFGILDQAKSLITEYETGLQAFVAKAKTITASGFSNSVVKLFTHAVWNVPVVPQSGAAVGTGVPGITAPAMVGIPEKLPTHTFIAHRDTEAGFGAGSLGFLRKAVLYHESYALAPAEVRSFEELVGILQAATTPIGRLRIITHFGGTANAGTLDNVGTMFIPFFTGQTSSASGAIENYCKAEHFLYGISDVEGLKGQFELTLLKKIKPDFLQGLTMNTSSDPVQREFHDAIFFHLQTNNDAVLQPFDLLKAKSTPSDEVRILMKWAAGLFFMNNATINVKATQPNAIPATPVDPSIKAAFVAAIQAKIDALVRPTGAFTQTNVDALVQAYSSLTFAALGSTLFSNAITYTFSSFYLENHDVLRAQLAIVKTRLNNSFVDIRGCRVGQDKNFLNALRTFFGNTGTEPTVSGPEWFQGFGTMGSFEVSGPLAGIESMMDSAFNSGIPDTSISGTDVQRDYSAWAGRIGINSQLSFWINLFNGSVYDLISLAWRPLLPPIGMFSERLDVLATQNYADAIATLKNIFHIDPNAAPLPADCLTFGTNSFPSIAALQAVITALVSLGDSSPQTALQAQRTALDNIATSVGATVPAVVNPITIANLNSCIDPIKQQLVTLSGIQPLVTSIKTRLTDSKAGYRYLFDIGLPLIVQSASVEGDSRLMYYTDLMPNALKSYKKIQFETPLPASAIAAINALNPTGPMVKNDQGTPNDPNDDTYNDTGTGLFFSSLSIDRNDTQLAIIPSEEFHEHIKTAP